MKHHFIGCWLICSALLLCFPVTLAASEPAEQDLVVQLQQLIGTAEGVVDDPDRVIEMATRALQMLEGQSFPVMEANARLLLSRALERKAEFDRALAEAQQALALAQQSADVRLVARAKYEVARNQWRKADYLQALRIAEEARLALQPAGPSIDLARCLSLLGAIHQSLADYSTALDLDLSALSMSDALQDEVLSARLRNNIGLIYWDLGRFEKALPYFNEALEVFERRGPQRQVSVALTNIALMLIEQDYPQRALPRLEKALAIDQASGDLYGQAKVYSNLAYAHEKMNQLSEALTFHARALTLREQIGDKDGIVRTKSVLASIRLAQGDPAAAVDIVQQAMPVALQIKERRSEAVLLEILSKALAETGDHEGALQAFRRFHALQSELLGEETARRVAQLEARSAEQEKDQQLQVLNALADTRRERVNWLIGGSIVLFLALVLLGALFISRVRSQRELAASEQRYRTVFGRASTPMFLLDRAAGCILDVNDAALELMSEYDVGMALIDVEPEWLRALLVAVEDVQESTGAPRDETWSDKDGQQRWAEVRCSRVLLGERICQIVSLKDTTDAHRLEAARQLEARMTSLGTLAGGIAHDFNNALAAVVGNIELARIADQHKREHLLQQAESAAFSARALTRQLLAFTKGGEPQIEVVDLKALLRESARMANAGSSMKLDFDIDPNLKNAEVDPGQISQVVANLVLNAQQATPEHGRLRIVAKNLSARPDARNSRVPHGYVRIDFIDNGEGVAAGIQDRVFDPYFSTRDSHSGLGLAVCYAICNNHGGVLMLESGPGKGADFAVILPATDALLPQPLDMARQPDGNASILVMDDDPQVRRMISRMLAQWGYQVDTVDDGALAVERYLARFARNEPYDLLILDLSVPGGTGGAQALKAILQHDPNALAFVVSGYADSPTMANYIEEGFAAALSKPFRREQLARLLLTHLPQKKSTVTPIR